MNICFDCGERDCLKSTYTSTALCFKGDLFWFIKRLLWNNWSKKVPHSLLFSCPFHHSFKERIIIIITTTTTYKTNPNPRKIKRNLQLIFAEHFGFHTWWLRHFWSRNENISIFLLTSFPSFAHCLAFTSVLPWGLPTNSKGICEGSAELWILHYSCRGKPLGFGVMLTRKLRVMVFCPRKHINTLHTIP